VGYLRKGFERLEGLEREHFRRVATEDTVERHWAIPKIIPKNRKLKILDLGAGSGYIASKILALGHDVIAMEIVAACLKQLRTRKIEVIPHNLSRAPYPIRDESFDGVLCADVLEHLLRPDVCLKEAYRVLKKDGFMIVSTPNYSHPYRIWQLIKGESFHEPPDYQFYAHIRFFTCKSLRRFLEHIGFYVADVFLPMPAISSFYEELLGGSQIKKILAMNVYPKIFYRLSPRFCNEPILMCRKERVETKTHLLRRENT